MKKSLVLILAGIMCVMLAASGCTSTSGTAPVTTTPAATTVVVTTSAPTAEATTAGATTTAPVTTAAAATTNATAPAPAAAPSWTGTWNSTWLENNGNHTVSVLTLTQTGQQVLGNYSYTYAGVGTFTGSLNATVEGKTLAGTYAESDNDVGLFVFELSEDKNTFTGRWVHAVNKTELASSKLTWNGVRK